MGFPGPCVGAVSWSQRDNEDHQLFSLVVCRVSAHLAIIAALCVSVKYFWVWVTLSKHQGNTNHQISSETLSSSTQMTTNCLNIFPYQIVFTHLNHFPCPTVAAYTIPWARDTKDHDDRQHNFINFFMQIKILRNPPHHYSDLRFNFN